MVKLKTFTAPVPGVTLENMLDLLIDPATYTEYHREIQVNDHVRVGPWSPAPESAAPPSQPGAPPLPPPPLTRQLAFLVSFRAPAWFKKAVGTETVKVRDGHALAWEREGGRPCDASSPLTRVTMRCAPRLWMPGGASEITIANVEFAVTPGVAGVDGSSPLTPSHGVTLTATVSTAAADSLKWLPGLRAALERVMLYQCEHMASTFVEVAARVAREAWGGLVPIKARAVGPLPAIPLPPPLRALRHRELSLPGTPTAAPAANGGRRRSSVFGASPEKRASAIGARRASAAGSVAETEFHDALDALSVASSQDGGPGSPLAPVAASPRASAAPTTPTADVTLRAASLKAGGAAELGLSLPRVRTSPKVRAVGGKKGAAASLRAGGVQPPSASQGGLLSRSLRRLVCLGGGGQ